jgi:hypothetical protein
MNKFASFLFACLVWLMSVSAVHAQSYPTPPANSPYMTDQQSSFAQDPTQQVFQDASNIGCMVNLMKPEQKIGQGQYLAVVDQNKCNASGSSGSSSSSASTQPSWVNALLNVNMNSDNSLDIVGSLYIPLDSDGKTKNIQIHATVFGGPKLYAPYGKWIMKFCSSIYPAVGTCSDGSGYISVDTTGVTLYEGGGGGSQAGVAVYTSSKTGYGVLAMNNSDGSGVNGKFRYADGVYLYDQTNPAPEQKMCYDPRLSNPNVKYSTWQNYLYDQSTGQKIAYTNPGFFISQHGTSNQIGEASYNGVNFWSNDTAEQASATTVDGPDGTVYTVHRMPGNLQKVTTSQVGMSALDGVTANFNFYENNGNGTVNIIQNQCSTSACAALNTNSNVSLMGSWSQANSQFSFTGYVDNNNNGAVTNFTAPPIGFSQLHTLLGGASTCCSGGGAWVNGANINYNFQLSTWTGSSTQLYTVANAPVTMQQSTTVNANALDDGTALYCVGESCPAYVGSSLSDVSTYQNNNGSYPPIAYQTLAWSQSLGAPTVSGHAVDWTPSALNPTQTNHYYQLYTAADLALMNCGGYWNNTNQTTGGYCANQVTTPASGSSTYYTWSSGGQWSSYAYLTNANGVSPTIAPPINLSYVVANAPGDTASYVGHTINVQSPEPGNLWLPGHCIDVNGATAACNSTNQWVSDVNSPFAQDATGTVNLLTSNGASTSTNYYVKWLQRGVYYASIPMSQCNTLDLSVTSGLTIPNSSVIDPSVAQQAFPAASAFQIKPSVVDGVLQ